MKRTVQIYGQFSGWWSNTGVSRGIAAAFIDAGFDVTIYDRDAIYEGMWTGPYTTGLSDAEIGVYVGYPARAAEYLANHPFKVGAFICESSTVPAEWAQVANVCDRVLVPSSWVAQAFIRAGASPARFIVVPHGIHPCYAGPPRVPHPSPTPEAPCFLHVAGARDFLERKGTYALIEGFRSAFEEGVAQLVVRTPTPVDNRLRDAAAGRGDVLFNFHDDALPPGRFREFLLGLAVDVVKWFTPVGRADGSVVELDQRRWTAVVQPSRAEAYGIIPVEARACGIPVILTGCSGHAAHARLGDVLIAHVEDGPTRANGIPNATAPQVLTGSITNALQHFVHNREKYQRIASVRTHGGGYGKRNQWTALFKERDVFEQLAPRKRRLSAVAPSRR